MPFIQIPRGVGPTQIEFGEGVERSKPGALYFTPNSTKKITQDEWEWIKEHHPQLASALVLVPFDETKGRIAKQKAAEAAKKPAPAQRPKDRMSKAKQRAQRLLEGKANAKPAAKIEHAIEHAIDNVIESKVEPDDDAKGSKSSKKRS